MKRFQLLSQDTRNRSPTKVSAVGVDAELNRHAQETSVNTNEEYSLGFWREQEAAWLVCDTAAERRSLAGELSLSCARPVADG